MRARRRGRSSAKGCEHAASRRVADTGGEQPLRIPLGSSLRSNLARRLCVSVASASALGRAARGSRCACGAGGQVTACSARAPARSKCLQRNASQRPDVLSSAWAARPRPSNHDSFRSRPRARRAHRRPCAESELLRTRSRAGLGCAAACAPSRVLQRGSNASRDAAASAAAPAHSKGCRLRARHLRLALGDATK